MVKEPAESSEPDTELVKEPPESSEPESNGGAEENSTPNVPGVNLEEPKGNGDAEENSISHVPDINLEEDFIPDIPEDKAYDDMDGDDSLGKQYYYIICIFVKIMCKIPNYAKLALSHNVELVCFVLYDTE